MRDGPVRHFQNQATVISCSPSSSKKKRQKKAKKNTKRKYQKEIYATLLSGPNSVNAFDGSTRARAQVESSKKSDHLCISGVTLAEVCIRSRSKNGIRGSLKGVIGSEEATNDIRESQELVYGFGESSALDHFNGSDAMNAIRGSDCPSNGVTAYDCNPNGIRESSSFSNGVRAYDFHPNGIRGSDCPRSNGIRVSDCPPSNGIKGSDFTPNGIRGSDFTSNGVGESYCSSNGFREFSVSNGNRLLKRSKGTKGLKGSKLNSGSEVVSNCIRRSKAARDGEEGSKIAMNGIRGSEGTSSISDSNDCIIECEQVNGIRSSDDANNSNRASEATTGIRASDGEKDHRSRRRSGTSMYGVGSLEAMADRRSMSKYSERGIDAHSQCKEAQIVVGDGGLGHNYTATTERLSRLSGSNSNVPEIDGTVNNILVLNSKINESDGRGTSCSTSNSKIPEGIGGDTRRTMPERSMNWSSTHMDEGGRKRSRSNSSNRIPKMCSKSRRDTFSESRNEVSLSNDMEAKILGNGKVSLDLIHSSDLNLDRQGRPHLDGQQPYLPGLDDEVALRCLAFVSLSDMGRLARVNKQYRELVKTRLIYNLRRWYGVVEHWVFIFTNGPGGWTVYNPKHDIWKSLPEASVDPTFNMSDRESLSAGTQVLWLGREVFDFVYYRYDLLTNLWEKGPPMPNPRWLFASASCGEFAFVAGGFGPEKSTLKLLNSAERYNSLSGQWEPLPPMSVPRQKCSGFYMDGKFYVIGGKDANHQPIMSGEEYDPLTMTWRTIEGMYFAPGVAYTYEPSPPLVAVVDNNLYAVDNTTNVLKVYDKVRNVWKDLGHLPVRTDLNNGWGVAFKALGDRLFVLGGIEGIAAFTWRPDPGCETTGADWQCLSHRERGIGSLLLNCAVMSC